MSKNKSNPPKKQVIVAPLQPNYKIFAFPNHYIPYIILAIISFGIYFNSIWNENALDDGIIIQKNEFVLEGTKGIKGILTKDSYYSFYRQMNAEDQLKGGRYRPLSVVSFAIEQEFIGPYPNGVFAKVRDLNNDGIIQEEEANKWDDVNGDGRVQDTECHECWDKNKANFYRDTVKIKDPKTGQSRAKFQSDTIPASKLKDKSWKGLPIYTEDINKDGNVNEKDCEVEGAKLRHFNNVFFYMISVVLLFGLLKNHLFRHNHDWAFLATLLFAIHPIHTEVVSNVKSRDEIFSILFITLTLTFSFRYMETKTTRDLILAGVMFFLALLSKEYALVLLPLIPLTFYAYKKIDFNLVKKAKAGMAKGAKKTDNTTDGRTASDWIELIFLNHLREWLLVGILATWAILMYKMAEKDPTGKTGKMTGMAIFYVIGALVLFFREIKAKTALGLIAVMSQFVIVYLAMRFSSVTLEPSVPDTEILNNPFLPVTTDDPSRGWVDDPESFWATKIFILLKYLGLLLWPAKLSSDYSFNTIEFRHFSNPEVLISLLVYIGLAVYTFILVFKKRSKLAFGLLFFFANLLMVGNILFDIGATMGERLVFHSSLGVAVAVAWIFTEGLERWIKNLAVQRGVVILGTLALVTAGSYKTWFRNYDWKNDITLFTKDVETVPNSVLVLGNAGARWIDKSEWPANTEYRVPYLKKAKGYLVHALDLHPKYVNGYLNLGLAYYKLHEFDVKQNYLDSAAITWKKAEQLYPTNPYIKIYYGVLIPRLIEEAKMRGQAQDFQTALRFMRLAHSADPNNPETNYNLGGAYHSVGKLDSAQLFFRRALQLNPNHKMAQEGLNAAINAAATQSIVPAPTNTLKP